MVNYNPKSWFLLVIDGYSKYVMKLLFPMLSFIMAVTAILSFLFIEVLEITITDTKEFHSILGLILGLFLVLRTNTAYDRWWEGRKLWGKLVNDCRQLSIKINIFIPKKYKEDKDFLEKVLCSLPFAMKEHLRNSDDTSEFEIEGEHNLNLIDRSNHKPNTINGLMLSRITLLFKKGAITGDQLIILDKEIKGFTDIIGACERIKTTPIPYSYSMFIKKFLLMYSLTLPLAFIGEFGYWSILLVGLSFYFLMSIELISGEIEDPFGYDINDLPLDSLCGKIRKNIIEIFNSEYNAL